MMRTWLKKMNKNWFPRQREGVRCARKPQSARLSVEALEKRELLSGGNTAGYLLSGGNLFHQTPSGLALLDSSVKDFCVPGSIVYDLHTDGRVFQISNGSFHQVYASAGALVSDATDNVFTLDSGNHMVLEHVRGAYWSWFQVGSDNASLVSDATGNVFALAFDDHQIYEHSQGSGGSWTLVSSYLFTLVGGVNPNISSLVSDAT